MAKQKFFAGDTNKSIDVFLLDSSKTDGSGLTGLAYNTTGLKMGWRLNNGASTLVSAGGSPAFATLADAEATHSDYGFVQISATNQPGMYRVDLHDNMLASAGAVRGLIFGAANLAPTPFEIEIFDPTYHARIQFIRDEANSQDEFIVHWYRNGVLVTSGITSPTLRVIKRSDGTNLFAAAALTQIGSTGAYKLDKLTTERLSNGEGQIAEAVATIGGASRTWRDLIGRDST